MCVPGCSLQHFLIIIKYWKQHTFSLLGIQFRKLQYSCNFQHADVSNDALDI